MRDSAIVRSGASSDNSTIVLDGAIALGRHRITPSLGREEAPLGLQSLQVRL